MDGVEHRPPVSGRALVWVIARLAAAVQERPVARLHGEQLPGGALVVVAYGFIWIATMVYIWFLWRRLSKVENEMRTLHQRNEAESRRR